MFTRARVSNLAFVSLPTLLYPASLLPQNTLFNITEAGFLSNSDVTVSRTNDAAHQILFFLFGNNHWAVTQNELWELIWKKKKISKKKEIKKKEKSHAA